MIDLSRNFINEYVSRGQIPTEELLYNNLSTEGDTVDLIKNCLQLGFLHKLIVHDFREILIHSPKNIQVWLNNELINSDIELSDEDFYLSLKIIALKNNIEWNLKCPSPSFTFFFSNKKMRITLLHPCLSSNNLPKVFIRNLKTQSIPLESFNIRDEQIKTIKKLIEDGKNIIVSGATGSGKSTFISSIIDSIPFQQHVLILEDTEEIYSQNPNHTKLLSQQNGFTLKEFLTFGLRMSPDRIIVGEIRSEEIIPFILAINTGHKGVMSTIHANSALDCIHRLALLFQMYAGIKELNYQTILKLITRNIDYVVHIEKREVKEIVRVVGSEDHNCYVDHVYNKNDFNV